MEVERVYTRVEAAALLGVTLKTLDNWRYTGRGPDFVKYPKQIVYRPAALNSYLNSLTVKPILTAA